MTDKELLEYAAKAAGWASWDWIAGDGILNVYDAKGRHDTFTPLADDGEAFRLAVKLDFKLYIGEAYAPRHGSSEWYCKGHVVDEDEEADPYAATRRAIVLAAAEIGKAMP